MKRNTMSQLLVLLLIISIGCTKESNTLLSGNPLGKELSVSVIQAKTVEDFGAIGDGITDDTQAWIDAAAWLSDSSYRKLETSSGAIYLITDSVLFDFKGNVGATLNMTSPIKTTAFSGNAFMFINGRDLDLTLYADGGGVLADYSKEMPSGGQNIFLIRGIRNSLFGIKARGCKSRIVKVDNAASNEIKTSLNVFKYLLTGDLVTGGSPTGNCGQSIWANGTTAFGTIQVAHTNWDEYGPVFNKVVDLTIEHWEGGWNKNNGAIFKGCGSLSIHSFAVGDESKTVTLIKFMAADDGTQPFTTVISSGLAVGGLRGIHVEDMNSSTQGISISNFKTTNSGEYGFYLKNVQNSKINIQSTYDYIGCRVVGNSGKLTLNMDIRESRSAGIQIANNVMGIELSGLVERCAKSFAAANVEVETVVDNIKFVNVMNRSTEALSKGCYQLPNNNKIYIIGGFVSGTKIFSASNPFFVQNLDGFKTQNSGEYNFTTSLSSITIAHGLALPPKIVNIVPTSINTAGGWYVDNITATSFTVNFSAPVSTGSFSWAASSF